MEFKGKTVIVTGGASGIGKETVRVFAEQGANVALIDLEQQACDEAARELSELTGNKNITGYEADVSSGTSVKKMVESVINKYGLVNCLVNSAAIRASGNVLTLDEEIWDKVIDVNLKGMFLTSKYCIPSMIEAGGGAIVHVSSVQAFANQKNVTAYAASKGGVNALTRAMANDHGEDGIRINAVAPGTTRTPALEKSASRFEGEKTLNDWAEESPLKRLGTSRDMAEFIVFLSSDKASYVTGSIHKVDGGLLAKLPAQLPEKQSEK